MADAILKDGRPLARITSTGRHGRDVWTAFQSEVPVAKAELNYTTDSGKWQDRNWQTVEATLDVEAGKASATLPEGVTVYYLNLTDERDLAVSSEHEEP